MKFDFSEWLYDNFDEKLSYKERELISDVDIKPRDLFEIDNYEYDNEINLKINDNFSIKIINDEERKMIHGCENNIIINILDDIGLITYNRYDGIIDYYDKESVETMKEINDYDMLENGDFFFPKAGLYPDIEINIGEYNDLHDYEYADSLTNAVNYIEPFAHKELIKTILNGDGKAFPNYAPDNMSSMDYIEKLKDEGFINNSEKVYSKK